MAEMGRNSNWWMMYISKKCNGGNQTDKQLTGNENVWRVTLTKAL